MILKKLFDYIPVFKNDKSGHRKYTIMYEDLCQ
jgi:hypothetical protein